MARGKQPTWDDIELLKPVRRYECFRRVRGYIERHIEQRRADGATEREIRVIERDLGEINRILADDWKFPLDDPPGAGTAPVRTDKDPIAPPGREAELLDIMNTIFGEEA